MSLCRACLHPEADVYLSLFVRVDQVPLDQMFHTLTGLTVSREDGLPRYVCQECSNRLLAFSNFRQKCIESDERLQILLNTPEETYPQSTEVEGTDDSQPDSSLEIETNLIVKEELFSDENDLSVEKLHARADSLSIELVHQTESHSEPHDVLDEVEAEENDVFYSSADESYVENGFIDTDKCNQQSAEEVSLMEERHNQELSLCCGCPKLQFASAAELMQHSTDVHRKERIHNNVRPYECHICFTRFASHAWLVQHQQNPYREKKFACKQCDASFLGRSALLSHRKSVHVRERSYVCDICQQAFFTSSTLSSHRHVHGEKKYQCKTCAKLFVRYCDLLSHQSTHLNERPYGCAICSKRFKTRSHLRAHQNVHTGKRALKCRHCDKCFAYYTDRRVHEFEHENIHLHQCTHCAKTYSRNFKLQDHIRRVHTGERPFACTECADKFFQRCELTAHQRVAHGKSADGNVHGRVEAESE